jgi:hypothetical protein
MCCIHMLPAGNPGRSCFGNLLQQPTPPGLTAYMYHMCYCYADLIYCLQHLFFGHSQAGDLRPYLCGYFDTSSGLKGEAGSYHNIQLTLGVDDPSEVRCCCCFIVALGTC